MCVCVISIHAKDMSTCSLLTGPDPESPVTASISFSGTSSALPTHESMPLTSLASAGVACLPRADWALVKGEGAATRCLCHKRGRQHEEVPTRESGHPVTQTPNSIIKQKQSESDC